MGYTQSNQHLYSLTVCDQLKGGQVVGRRVVLWLTRYHDWASPNQLDLSCSKGLILGFAISQIAVEADHQLGGGAIFDGPQGGSDRA